MKGDAHVISVAFSGDVEEAKEHIKQQMRGRAYRSANELRNAALTVLRGQRSGRRYKVPGTYRRQRDKVTGKMRNGRYYTASAPGEPPAVRTGTFRNSWKPSAVYSDAYGEYWSRISSDVRTENGRYNLGDILEDGTQRMAPRPYGERIIEKAMPNIRKIYSEPYF